MSGFSHITSVLQNYRGQHRQRDPAALWKCEIRGRDLEVGRRVTSLVGCDVQRLGCRYDVASREASVLLRRVLPAPGRR